MTDNLDLSVEIAGFKSKSPVLVSSSECTSEPSLLEKLIQKNIGGIVTKTFTSPSEYRVRVRPYQFPLNVFGSAYREGRSLYSLAAPHVEDMSEVIKKVSQMAKVCKDSSVALIASYFEDPNDVPLWVERAKAFEEIGADMLELNFSSPSAARVFASSFDISNEVISQVKAKTSIPIGLKLSPTLEPLEAFVTSCGEAGLDFITAHNGPSGMVIDVENEVPFGAPAIGGYVMGRTFLPYSLARVVRIRRVTRMPVIGVGGIYNSGDALQYLLCGCPLVGIGSAMYYEGAEILDSIFDGISDWMERKGYGSIEDFRGKVFPLIEDSTNLRSREPYPFTMPPEGPYVPIIDDEECTLCGACERSCIYGVLKVDEKDSKVFVDENRCWSCGFCVGVCPAKAIELRDRHNRERVIWKNEGMAEPFKI